MRSKQKFEKARGRPSIQEMNYKSVQREEEKRKQKKSFGEDTRKKMRSIGMRDAAEDEAGGGEGGESGDSSSSKVGRVRHFVNGGRVRPCIVGSECKNLICQSENATARHIPDSAKR